MPFARHHSILGQGTQWRIFLKNSGLDGRTGLGQFTLRSTVRVSPIASLRVSRAVAIRPISSNVEDLGADNRSGLRGGIDTAVTQVTQQNLCLLYTRVRELNRSLRHLRHYCIPGSIEADQEPASFMVEDPANHFWKRWGHYRKFNVTTLLTQSCSENSTCLGFFAALEREPLLGNLKLLGISSSFFVRPTLFPAA